MAQPSEERANRAMAVASLMRAGHSLEEALALWERRHGPLSGTEARWTGYWAQRLEDVRRAARDLEPGQQLRAALEGAPAPSGEVDVPVLVEFVYTDPATGRDRSRWITLYERARWSERIEDVMDRALERAGETQDRYGEPSRVEAHLSYGFLFTGGYGSRQH